MNNLLEYLKRIKPAGWLKGCLYGLLLSIVYQSAIRQLIINDWAKEDYSHCMLIPFVILYLLWEKRDRLAAVAASPSWLGLLPLGLGIGLFWVGELGGEFFSMYVSMWLVVVGLLWLHLGWQKIKTMGFALLIGLTMFPFPNFINAKVLVKLKLISSQLGVAMLQAYGMSAYREGNIIDLGFTQLQVVDACSGMRYVLPLMVLSLLLAYWFKGSLWKKVLIFLSSLPLAVLVNSLRIALTGILYSAWGPEVAEGFFHGFSGWLIFMFTLPVLLLEMWVLNKIGRKVEGVGCKGEAEEINNGRKAYGVRCKGEIEAEAKDKDDQHPLPGPPPSRGREKSYGDPPLRGREKSYGDPPSSGREREEALTARESEVIKEGRPSGTPLSLLEREINKENHPSVSPPPSRDSEFNEESPPSVSPPPRRGRVRERGDLVKALLQPVFVAAMVVLIATYALSHGIEFREKIPINKPFSEFPMNVGEWSGKRQAMEQAMVEALHFSDYIMATYRNPDGGVVDFYVAYYESQRKGEATHSPETCLPGSGWEFKQSGTKSVDLGGGKSMLVNRALMVKNDYRQLAYFWFPQRGRILTGLPQVKLYAFWDALTRQRTDGALVRVITPVGAGEETGQAEKRLTGFVRVITPVLDEYIPK